MAPLHRLSDLLDVTDLPEAELRAAVLDGEIARVGPVFSPIDIPPSARHRARALRPVLPPRLIADRRTAAWVHGAILTLPERIEACARSDARASALLISHASVRQVVIDDHEILNLGGVRVTTPRRTIIDLIRSPVFDPSLATIVQTLSRRGEVSLSDCLDELALRRHLPKKGEAIERLTLVLKTKPATPH